MTGSAASGATSARQICALGTVSPFSRPEGRCKLLILRGREKG